MKYRTFKLIFIINFFFVAVVCSQGRPKASSGRENAVLSQYNSWLKGCGLGQLLTATDISVHTMPGPALTVLTLKPAGLYTSAKTFPRAWYNTAAKLKKSGVDIDQLLPGKFSSFSFLPLEQVMVVILGDTQNEQNAVNTDYQNAPGIFYYEIRFNERIHTENNLVLERGPEKATVDVDVNSLKDVCLETASRPAIKFSLAALDQVFKSYPAGKGGISIDSIVNPHKTGITYRISNIDGRVTHSHLHELIILKLTLDPAGVCYQIDVFYSGGLRAPDPDYDGEHYHEVAQAFKKEYDIYRDQLEKKLRGVFHAK